MDEEEREELRALTTKLSLARANGDPNKYIAGITVHEAHRAAYFITLLQARHKQG